MAIVSEAESDRQLLSRYTRDGDGRAFRRLVTRHGPAVLQVCRAVLRDSHAADDAFQATFLVLVRKAPAIRDPGLLGEWLRGVAYRTAMHARGERARRRESERKSAAMARIDSSTPEAMFETRRIVREELERLPEVYRDPVTLCYMEGLTQEEAARRLGWPIGTVKTRVVRGRRLLRERLDRRGVGLGAALILWLLDPSRAQAAPESLTAATVKGMSLLSAGRSTESASHSGRALDWAQAIVGGVLGGSARWPWMVLVLAAVLVGLGGPAVLAHQSQPASDPRSILPKNLTDILNVECH